MTRDPIVDEIRAIRDAIAKEYNYDIAEIFDALRRMEREESTAPVTLPARPARARAQASAAQPDIAADGAPRRS